MKKSLLSMCVFIATAFAVSTLPPLAMAADNHEGKTGKKAKKRSKNKGEQARKGKQRKRGRHAVFKELDLTGDQKTKIKSLLAENREQRKELAQQRKGIQEKMKAAKKDGNKEKLKEIQKEMKGCGAKAAELDKKEETAILAVLKPEQRARWHKLKIYEDLLKRLKKAKLADDQKQKIKDICLASTEDISPATKKKIINKILNTIREEVLNDEQKDKIGGRKGRGNKDGDKPRKEKKGKKKGNRRKKDTAEGGDQN